MNDPTSYLPAGRPGMFHVLDSSGSLFAEGARFSTGRVVVTVGTTVSTWPTLSDFIAAWPGNSILFVESDTERILRETRRRSRGLMQDLRQLPGWDGTTEEDFADKVRRTISALQEPAKVSPRRTVIGVWVNDIAVPIASVAGMSQVSTDENVDQVLRDELSDYGGVWATSVMVDHEDEAFGVAAAELQGSHDESEEEDG